MRVELNLPPFELESEIKPGDLFQGANGFSFLSGIENGRYVLVSLAGDFFAEFDNFDEAVAANRQYVADGVIKHYSQDLYDFHLKVSKK